MTTKKIRAKASALASCTKLTLTPYKPNFADPRLKKRMHQVLTWCESLLLARRPVPVHHDKLRHVFGNTGRNPGRWLYSKLLHQVGSYTPGQHSYSYVLNVDGYEQLHELAGIEQRSAAIIATEKYADVLKGVEAIEYADRGDRRYHAVQNLKRQVRTVVFDGWWDYDIDACAPTLLYQYVSEAGDDGWGEKWLPTIRKLAFDKVSIRQHVQRLIGLDEKTVKRLVNAIFFKAVLSPHSASTVFQQLGQREDLLYLLKADVTIKALRREVRFMWELAHNRYRRELVSLALRGIPRSSVSVSRSKQRNAIYRMLERQVINAMEDLLPPSLLGCVLMHDGFMAKDRVNINRLQDAVRQRTGFNITLKEVRLGRAEMSDEPDPLGEDEE